MKSCRLVLLSMLAAAHACLWAQHPQPDADRLAALRDSIDQAGAMVRRQYVADSVASVDLGQDALFEAWRRYAPLRPSSDSLLSIAAADTVAARRDEWRRQVSRRVDSLRSEAAGLTPPAVVTVGQADLRLPVIFDGRLSHFVSPTLTDLANASQASSRSAAEGLPSGRAFRLASELGAQRKAMIADYATSHLRSGRVSRSMAAVVPVERRRVSTQGLLAGEHLADAAPVAAYVPIEGLPSIRADKWHYKGQHQLQMTQTSLSDNWYKGGENNLTIFTDTKVNIMRYDEKKVTTFETTIDLRLSGYYTKADTVHPMRVNDNQLTFDAKYGYRAWKRWYYSANLYAKTPVFEYFKANSRVAQSAFLSPFELNIGLGMDYKFENKAKTFTYSLMLAPLSYNLKYVNLPERVNVKSYGIDADRRALNQYGSTLTSKMEWKITKDISWTSRLYVFTSYESVLGEFENTFNFKVNNLFSATLYAYPRFDDSKFDKHWQMKETFSFGFNFVW